MHASRPAPRSGGQNLAALRAARGQNLAAVAGSHSFTEAVNLGTLTLLRLIGTEHCMTPPNIKIRQEKVFFPLLLDGGQKIFENLPRS
jgi:hypothetical protein